MNGKQDAVRVTCLPPTAHYFQGGVKMDNLVFSLGPAFAAGLAVQQLLELADRFIEQFLKIAGAPLGINLDKKLILGLISLLMGLIITIGAGLRVLAPLGVKGGDFADVIVTAFIISAGTESFNSILKLLGYVKEDRKITAAVKKQNAPEEAIAN